MNASEKTTIRCLLLDDDPMDFAYTEHCLRTLLADRNAEIEHVATIEDADAALQSATFDIAILDYYVGSRTPMSLLRHFESAQTGCVVLILSSVHPSIVSPFLAAIGQGAFLDKTSFSARALAGALKKAGWNIDQADAANGNGTEASVLSTSANIA